MFRFSNQIHKLLTTLLSSAVVFYSTSSLASSASHGEHGEAHISNWWNMSSEVNSHAPALGWVMVTFLIFIIGIYFAMRKEFKNSINKRADDIGNAIKEAQKAKQEAMAVKAEFEKKLQNLDGDIEGLKAEFEERGQAEKKRIIESAEQATLKILKDSEDTMNAELARAKISLKEEATRLAFDIAEQTIKQTISAADDQRLQANFIQDVMN